MWALQQFLVTLPLVALAVSAQADPATTNPPQTVVSLFLGARRESNYSFVGSVIGVDATATTYEVACASGALNMPGFPTTTCDVKDPAWTVTDGPSTMAGTLTTGIASVTAVLDEQCTIEGRTAAYCNYTYVGGSSGAMTSTQYTTDITGSLYVDYPVTITAGAEKLSPAETSAPSGTGSSASTTESSSSTSGVEKQFPATFMLLAVALFMGTQL